MGSLFRRRVSVLASLRRTVTVLLGLLWVSLMTAETTCYLGLEASVLLRLPLADVAVVDVLGLHGDERNPTQLEPRACLGLHYLRIVAPRTHARRPITLLLDLGRTPKDHGDEEAEVLDHPNRQNAQRRQ